MPNNQQYNDECYGDTGMKTTAVGISLFEVLSKLTAIRFYVGCVFRRFATLYLLLALSFCHEAVEFVLSL